MYQLQKYPGTAAQLENGSTVTPVATLKDEHGGVSHIIVDDHCYVLINSAAEDGSFRMSYHWYPEAVEVMKQLPVPSKP